MIWLVFHLALIFNSEVFHVTLNERDEKHGVIFINNLFSTKKIKMHDTISLVDKIVDTEQQLMNLQNFFKLDSIPQYISIDFNGMIIDCQNIFEGNYISTLKALFEINNLVNFNIYNAIFTHQHQPIFIFAPNSLVKIVNCSITNSKFDFIPEIIAIPSSDVNFFNFTVDNIILNKASLMTIFHSYTEMTNISVHSTYIFDCSLINNVDGTLSINNFSILKCNGYSSTIFNSIGSVYFTANNLLAFNFTFKNESTHPSFIFYSDFSLELIIQNLTIKNNVGIGVFNGIFKYLDLYNVMIANSTFYNENFINAEKSGNFILTNTNIQNCICKSIIHIDNSISFTILNSSFNNLSNPIDNKEIFYEESQKCFSLFLFSKVSSKISINSTVFSNIINTNTIIFSIYNSIAIFDNVYFKKVQMDSFSCCIKTDSRSNLIVVNSFFPTINNGHYYPIYSDGTFSVHNIPVVSKENNFLVIANEIRLNNKIEYWNKAVFILLVFIQIILFASFAIIPFLQGDYQNQYEIFDDNYEV